MEAMYYISLYLAIGACIQVIYDLIEKYYFKDEVSRFNEFDKLTSILLWPVGLVIFLTSFFTAFINRDKDD
tara:strand:+ start:599 stop:811 length:213 start_codon:yes stop_codon:yes gene_type:complete